MSWPEVICLYWQPVFPWIDILQFVEQFTHWKHPYYFQNLTIASNSGINICVKVFTQSKFSLPLGKIPMILDHMRGSELWLIVFKKLPFCLPKWPHYFAFPSAMNEFLMLHVLMSICCFRALAFSCPNGWLVVSLFF